MANNIGIVGRDIEPVGHCRRRAQQIPEGLLGEPLPPLGFVGRVRRRSLTADGSSGKPTGSTDQDEPDHRAHQLFHVHVLLLLKKVLGLRRKSIGLRAQVHTRNLFNNASHTR